MTTENHKDALKSALIISVISLILGVVFNILRAYPLPLWGPMVAPYPGDITTNQAREKQAEVVFIDARSAEVYTRGHLPNALHLEVKASRSLSPEMRERLAGRTLIVYCSGPRCPKAERVRRQLVRQHFGDILILREGYSAWKKAGFPVSRGS